jgi:hypothetical protein
MYALASFGCMINKLYIRHLFVTKCVHDIELYLLRIWLTKYIVLFQQQKNMIFGVICYLELYNILLSIIFYVSYQQILNLLLEF